MHQSCIEFSVLDYSIVRRLLPTLMSAFSTQRAKKRSPLHSKTLGGGGFNASQQRSGNEDGGRLLLPISVTA